MAKKEDLLAGFEKAYENARAKEAEALHNALVEVIHEQKASLQNTLFVLDLIRHELMDAKYKEVMGVVKLGEKLPVAPIKKEE